MKIEAYTFLFHPFSNDHSTATKALSVIVGVALAALTAGVYAAVFVGVRVYEACFAPYLDSKGAKKAKTLGEDQLSLGSGPSGGDPSAGSGDSLTDRGAAIKTKQAEHLIKLQTLSSRGGGNWDHLAKHTHHPDSGFDWWMFPVNRDSAGNGDEYSVDHNDIRSLKKDKAFMDSYRKGVILVAKSWGWNVETGDKETSLDQNWSGYQVRLGKMLSSLRIFKQWDLRDHLVKHAKRDCHRDCHHAFEAWILTEISHTHS